MITLSHNFPVPPFGVWIVLLIPMICGGLIILYLFAAIIYNLFLHPLRDYPGPKLWAATRVPWLLHTFKGTIHHRVLDLHNTYGPTVRVAPDEISYTSSAAYRDIYAFNPKGECPKDLLSQQLTVNGVPSLLAANREDHGRFRRLLSYAFSDRGLRDAEPKIYHYANLLTQRLREKCTGTEPLDMVKFWNAFTFDLIGDLAYGESFNCLSEDVVLHPWIQAIAGAVKVIPIVNFFRRYNMTWLLPYLVSKDLMQRRLKTYHFTKDRIDRRITLGSERGDFWDKIITSSDKSQDQKENDKAVGMTEKEMVSNGQSLVIAGSETTATLLSGATYLLLTHPDKLAKLTAELRAQFSTEVEITIQAASSQRYLLAVLDEALRLYPPVPNSLNRRAPHPDGRVVCGRYVPPGTSLAIPQWATHRSASNFHRPEEFIPERTLPEEPEWEDAFEGDDRAALQPFAVGPRNCIGRNLAYAEMRLVMARVVWGFEMQLVGSGEGDWMDQKVYLLWDKKPLWVRLRARE